MTADALDITNYLINKGLLARRPITSMKLHKLLYYAQGYWMALHDGEPLFERELKRLPYGPVCVYVLNKFKKQGAAPMTQLHPEGDIERLDHDVIKHLDKVWNTFGKFTPYQLSEMSHKERPWRDTMDNDVIPPVLLFDYFTQQLKQNLASAGK